MTAAERAAQQATARIAFVAACMARGLDANEAAAAYEVLRADDPATTIPGVYGQVEAAIAAVIGAR